MDTEFEAMAFARRTHAGHKRKYTGDPYVTHLAEVAAIATTVIHDAGMRSIVASVSWLHDTMEDHGVTYHELERRFGSTVAEGVLWLSDLEPGNRKERKTKARERLSGAPWWVHTIKVADLISNTPSIMLHDPKFARVYVPEKKALLEVLTKADHRLLSIANDIIKEHTP